MRLFRCEIIKCMLMGKQCDAVIVKRGRNYIIRRLQICFVIVVCMTSVMLIKISLSIYKTNKSENTCVISLIKSAIYLSEKNHNYRREPQDSESRLETGLAQTGRNYNIFKLNHLARNTHCRMISRRGKFICAIFSFVTHEARALSADTFDKAIRSRRVMREEGATKRDVVGDARAGQVVDFT